MTDTNVTSQLSSVIHQPDPMDDIGVRLLKRISFLENQLEEKTPKTNTHEKPKLTLERRLELLIVEYTEFSARLYMLYSLVKEQRALNRRSHELNRWLVEYEKQPSETERDQLSGAYDDYKRRADALDKLIADYESLTDLNEFRGASTRQQLD